MRAIDTKRIHEAIYPGDEDATVWRYRIPTLREDEVITRAAQATSAGGAFAVNGAAQETMALRLCMEPPSNFLDDEGNEVAWTTKGHSFRTNAPDDAFLERVPPHVRTWLANLIQSGASPTKSEAGNS